MAKHGAPHRASLGDANNNLTATMHRSGSGNNVSNGGGGGGHPMPSANSSTLPSPSSSPNPSASGHSKGFPSSANQNAFLYKNHSHLSAKPVGAARKQRKYSCAAAIGISNLDAAQYAHSQNRRHSRAVTEFALGELHSMNATMNGNTAHLMPGTSDGQAYSGFGPSSSMHSMKKHSLAVSPLLESTRLVDRLDRLEQGARSHSGSLVGSNVQLDLMSGGVAQPRRLSSSATPSGSRRPSRSEMAELQQLQQQLTLLQQQQQQIQHSQQQQQQQQQQTADELHSLQMLTQPPPDDFPSYSNPYDHVQRY
jgi:hypothetical protein